MTVEQAEHTVRSLVPRFREKARCVLYTKHKCFFLFSLTVSPFPVLWCFASCWSVYIRSSAKTRRWGGGGGGGGGAA